MKVHLHAITAAQAARIVAKVRALGYDSAVLDDTHVAVETESRSTLFRQVYDDPELRTLVLFGELR